MSDNYSLVTWDRMLHRQQTTLDLNLLMSYLSRLMLHEPEHAYGFMEFNLAWLFLCLSVRLTAGVSAKISMGGARIYLVSLSVLLSSLCCFCVPDPWLQSPPCSGWEWMALLSLNSKLTCGSCNACYDGKTSRHFCEQVREHYPPCPRIDHVSNIWRAQRKVVSFAPLTALRFWTLWPPNIRLNSRVYER